MSKSNKAGIFTIVALMAGIFTTGAQINFSNWQAGINGGLFVYQGDLTPQTFGSYRTLQPAVGFYISRVLNPSFILRTILL